MSTFVIAPTLSFTLLHERLQPYLVPIRTTTSMAQTDVTQRPVSRKYGPAPERLAGFCERHDIKVLRLGQIHRGVIVTHSDRLALGALERREEEHRHDLVEESMADYREGFAFLSRELLRMHQLTLERHHMLFTIETRSRSSLIAEEERARIPISHARCAEEYSAEYLGQILKRGSILEDDLKRERKMTGQEEEHERKLLSKKLAASTQALQTKLAQNIEYMNIQASTFSRAAHRFHSVLFERAQSRTSDRLSRTQPSQERIHASFSPLSLQALENTRSSMSLPAPSLMELPTSCGTRRHPLNSTIEIQKELASKPAQYKKHTGKRPSRASTAASPRQYSVRQSRSSRMSRVLKLDRITSLLGVFLELFDRAVRIHILDRGRLVHEPAAPTPIQLSATLSVDETAKALCDMMQEDVKREAASAGEDVDARDVRMHQLCWRTCSVLAAFGRGDDANALAVASVEALVEEASELLDASLSDDTTLEWREEARRRFPALFWCAVHAMKSAACSSPSPATVPPSAALRISAAYLQKALELATAVFGPSARVVSDICKCITEVSLRSVDVE